MKPANIAPAQLKLICVVVLILANAIVWGSKVFVGSPEGKVYSTGTVFSVEGMPIHYFNTLQFKDDYFSNAVKLHWQEKTNTMQEAGTVTRGFFGEYKILLKSTSSHGTSVLDEVELGDELSFNRGYLQGGNAIVSLLPISGPFPGVCYYFIYMKKVHCGSGTRSYR